MYDCTKTLDTRNVIALNKERYNGDEVFQKQMPDKTIGQNG